MHSRDLHVHEGKRVFVRLPPPSSTAEGAATRFLRKYDGLHLVTGHVHGREDLLRLRHLSTGKEIRAVNIEKIVVVLILILVQTSVMMLSKNKLG